jgi:hypothetical protein
MQLPYSEAGKEMFPKTFCGHVYLALSFAMYLIDVRGLSTMEGQYMMQTQKAFLYPSEKTILVMLAMHYLRRFGHFSGVFNTISEKLIMLEKGTYRK